MKLPSQRRPGRGRFQATCETLEGRQLLSVANLTITNPVASVQQGQPLSIQFEYDANSNATPAVATETLKVDGSVVGLPQTTKVAAIPNVRDHHASRFDLDTQGLSTGPHTFTVNVHASGNIPRSGDTTASDDHEDEVVDVTVNVLDTRLSTPVSTWAPTYGHAGRVETQLTDSAGNEISDELVTFTASVNGQDVVLGTAKTDLRGVAAIGSATSWGLHANEAGYALKVSFAGDSVRTPGLKASEATGLLVVGKADLSITVPSQTKVYGDADNLTYQTVGLVGSDYLDGALTRDAGETVGTYAIAQGSLVPHNAGDYNVTFTGGQLQILQRNLEVSYATQDALNLAKQGTVSFTITNLGAGLVDNAVVQDTVQSLVAAAAAYRTTLTIDGNTFNAVLSANQYGQLVVSLTLASAEADGTTLRQDLLADAGTATSAAKVVPTDLDLLASLQNYTFDGDAFTRIFSSTK